MFCNKCGKEIREGAAFCTGCGAKVKMANLPQRPAGAGSEHTVASAAGISEGSHGGSSGTTTPEDLWVIGLLLAIVVAGLFFLIR